MQQAALHLWAKDMKVNFAEAQKIVHARARDNGPGRAVERLIPPTGRSGASAATGHPTLVAAARSRAPATIPTVPNQIGRHRHTGSGSLVGRFGRF